MIDVLKIHSRSLKYSIGKLTEAWRTPIYYGSLFGSRDGCRPVQTSLMKQLFSLVAGFAITSTEYISQYF